MDIFLPARRAVIGALLLLILSVMPPARAQSSAAPRFAVTFTPAVSEKPFSGRLYVMLGPEGSPDEPRHGPDWFQPQPFFAVDVKNKRPGEVTLIGGPGTISFPKSLHELAPGAYVAQAVLDRNQGERDFSSAPGNGYSAPVRFTLGGANREPVRLAIDKVVPPRRFRESERVREVDMESRLLSRFYGKPIRMRAAVILPQNYGTEDTTRRYPIVYTIPGFGGRHYGARARPLLPGEIPMIQVVLTPIPLWVTMSSPTRKTTARAVGRSSKK